MQTTPHSPHQLNDEVIRRGSGKTWDEWIVILDAWGAAERTHTGIARYVHEAHGVDGWWAQAVTVGYERGKGRRWSMTAHAGTP